MTLTPEKKGSIKKDAVFVYAGYVLRYLGHLVLIPYYGRVLGPDNYGQVLAALSLMTIVMAVLGFGFSLRGTRDIACATSCEVQNQVFNAHMMGRILLLPAGIIVTVIGWYFSKALAGNIMFAVLAFLIAVTSAFNFGWFFQGIRKFKTSIAIDTMIYPLHILFALLFVRGPEDGIWALWSLFLAGMVCLAVAFVLCRKHVDPDFGRVKDGMQEIRGATILFLTSISYTVLNSGSTYLLSTTGSTEDVAFYGAAERFFSIALGLLIPLAQVMMPTISNAQMSDKVKATKLTRKAISLESLYGFLGCCGGVLLAPFLIPLIMGDGFSQSVLVFQLLICSLPFAALQHAFSYYIYLPMKYEKLVLIISVVNAGSFLTLALILTPLWDGEGMAAARIVSEFMALSLSLVFLYKNGLFKSVITRQ